MRNGIGRSMVRGALASVAGIVAMDLWFKAMKQMKERGGSDEDEQQQQQSGSKSNGEAEHALDDISVAGKNRKEGEPATVAVGRIAYEKAKGREPSREKGAQLGKAVHWGYGLAMGGLFGLLEPRAGDHDLSAGLGYGAALWLLGDELAVPMLGLSKGPTAHSPRVHAEALGAHLVYGLATGAATRALQKVM